MSGNYIKIICIYTALFLMCWNLSILAEQNFSAVDRLFSGSTDGADNVKCGFPVILQANSPGNLPLLLHLQSYNVIYQDLDQTYFSPSGHFEIHYTTGGYNAIPSYDRDQNGTPDFVEFVGISFDRAWSVEIDSLGFRPPPDSSGQNRSIYPIFCRRLGVYGQTWLDYEIPSLPGNNYVTYTEINTNFNNIVTYPGVDDPVIRDSMAIAITAAHEFNHALQSGYRLWPEDDAFFDLWYIESSATYMEEVVAREVRDYLQYLDDYFNNTRIPLDQSSGSYSDYGKVVLEIMLGKLYGADIVRKVWSEIRFQRALPSLQKVLLLEGTDLRLEWRRLALWMHFTADLADSTNYFPDGMLYPPVRTLFANNINNSQTILTSDSLARLSFQWYSSFASENLLLEAYLKADENAPAADLFSHLINPSNGVPFSIPAAVLYRLPFPVNSQHLLFGIVNTFMEGNTYSGYQMITRPTTVSVNPSLVVYPQPLRVSQSQPYLNFQNLPPSATLYIFSSNGLLLNTISISSSVFSWDLTTRNGDKVGSGVYLYKVISDQEEATGKFIIVK
jgi:hypothetical protein